MDGGLCDELLEEVLRRLPQRGPFFASSTADVSLVSKRWLRLYRSTRSTLSPPLPRRLYAPRLPLLFPLSLPLSLLPLYHHRRRGQRLEFSRSDPSLRRLFLSQAHTSLPPTWAGLSLLLLSLSTSCPHLTSLDIALPRPFCSHWLRFFHSLKNLNVSFLSVPKGFEPVDAACEGNFDSELKLETLHVSRIQRGDYGLNWLWKSCKNLRKLQLNRCEGIGDDTSRSWFVKCLKGLQEVELIHCSYEILSKLVNKCASYLSSLLVHDSFGGTKGLRQFITHSRCNLRKLDLRKRHGQLRETDLLAMGEKFRGLLSLRLHGFFSNTDEGLKTMMLAMSNELEELALVNCNLGPGLLTTLGQKFRNLRKLDLSSNRRMLVDEEFISMLGSCNFLTELKVRSCRGLANASLASMFFTSCKQLESVDIMDCPGIGAEYVAFFVLNCPRLRQICVEESKLSDVFKLWASKKLIELVFH